MELHRSEGLHDLGEIKWDIALCLFVVYLICYFSLWKGISTSGKVVWFTALFPYAVLLILLVRGVTLPGSAEGIKYYLSPDFSAITQPEVTNKNSPHNFRPIMNNPLLGLGRCSNAGFLFFRSRIWSFTGICILQQIPQQCLQVRISAPGNLGLNNRMILGMQF